MYADTINIQMYINHTIMQNADIAMVGRYLSYIDFNFVSSLEACQSDFHNGIMYILEVYRYTYMQNLVSFIA